MTSWFFETQSRRISRIVFQWVDKRTFAFAEFSPGSSEVSERVVFSPTLLVPSYFQKVSRGGSKMRKVGTNFPPSPYHNDIRTVIPAYHDCLRFLEVMHLRALLPVEL